MPPELAENTEPAVATLAAALDALAMRYAECARVAGDGDGRWAVLTEELRFAGAALRHAGRCGPAAAHPPGARVAAHLAVIGPTQVGKSTVVNALLGAPAAAVSPLAGFTVHPQGFWLGPEAPSGAVVDALFRGRRRVAPDELSRELLDAFAFSPAPPARERPILIADGVADQVVVVWDTPDFDSTRASAYRAGVFDTVAFADAIVFVLSLEKHGDREGWDIFRTISRLNRPCLVCINKMTEAAEEQVLAQVRVLLAEHGGGSAEIMTLPLAPATASGAALPDGALRKLGEAAASALRRGGALDRRPGVACLLEDGWERWWRPVRDEHAAAGAWQALVDAALEDAVSSYRRDFLDHPQRYDSFNAVVVELLRRIELPLVGDALHRARQVVTWPLRQALAYGRRWMSGETAATRVPEEERVLRDLVDALLTRLERDAGRRTDAITPAAGFWQALYARLAAERPALQGEFEHALRRHAELLREEVRSAAGDLHARLKENPVVLNSLRTALTAGDVLSVVVAVKSFGLAPSDALLIPALVAVSSTLTQGALAAYIGAVRDRLKQRQLANVRARMDDALAGPLRALAASVSGERVIGIGAGVLAEASAALRAWTSTSREGVARARGV